jgi:excinuclease ABC subunit C
MLDERGELIYVGKAKSLRGRLLSYFRPRSRDAKAGRIVADARQVVWEPAACEFAALLRELELIRRWQPRFNVQGQPRRQRLCYVCVGRGPAPYVFITPRPTRTAAACFGPLPGLRRAYEAARHVNNWFRLRDCPQSQEMVFADQSELFPVLRTAGCLRLEIGHCTGPCAAACTSAAYGEQVQAAVAFLRGEDLSPLEILEGEMNTASAVTQFERAAALRDRFEALGWLSACLCRVREAVTHSFVYRARGHDHREWWYVIHQGRVRAVVPAPRSADGRARVDELLAAAYRPGRVAGLPGPDEIDMVLLVDAWFRRYPEELARTLMPEAGQ